MTREAPALQLVDVREPTTVSETIPGAIAMPLDAPVRHALPATDADTPIVVFCACPNEISAALVALRLRAAGYHHTYALAGGFEAWQRETAEAMSETG